MTARPHTIALIALVVVSRTTGAQHPTSQARGQSQPTELTTKAARLAFIRKAQVWAPTEVSRMDLRAGPQGPGSFQPNAAVTCDYVQTKLPGTSPKFDCDLGQGDIVKVRYGARNG